MDDIKENVNSIHSPLHGQRGKKIVSDIRKRCLERSRKYTLKDLNELRHLPSCRAMPDGICHSTEIFSPGLGLSIVSTNSLSTTKEVRFKQIQIAKNMDGYKHYIALIPHKHQRIRNVHPMTPTISETLTLSKRHFDKKIKLWKKELHRWDAIQSVSDIPHHLVTKRMLNDRNMHHPKHNNNSANQAHLTWSPKSPQKTISHASEREESESTQCIKQLVFDDDQKDENVYSPSKDRWYKLKNGSHSKVEITRQSAIECLKLCISNVRACNSNNENECD
eukprot:455498_1